jgi:hypothetical protein
MIGLTRINRDKLVVAFNYSAMHNSIGGPALIMTPLAEEKTIMPADIIGYFIELTTNN